MHATSKSITEFFRNLGPMFREENAIARARKQAKQNGLDPGPPPRPLSWEPRRDESMEFREVRASSISSSSAASPVPSYARISSPAGHYVQEQLSPDPGRLLINDDLLPESAYRLHSRSSLSSGMIPPLQNGASGDWYDSSANETYSRLEYQSYPYGDRTPQEVGATPESPFQSGIQAPTAATIYSGPSHRGSHWSPNPSNHFNTVRMHPSTSMPSPAASSRTVPVPPPPRPRLQHTHSMPTPDTSTYRAAYSISPIGLTPGNGAAEYRQPRFPPEPDAHTFYSPEHRYLSLAPMDQNDANSIQFDQRPHHGLVMPDNYGALQVSTFVPEQLDNNEFGSPLGNDGDAMRHQDNFTPGSMYRGSLERYMHPYLRYPNGL